MCYNHKATDAGCHMLGAYPVVPATGSNMLENETCAMLKTVVVYL